MDKVQHKYVDCLAQEKSQDNLHRKELLKIAKEDKLLDQIKDAMIINKTRSTYGNKKIKVR